MATPQELEEQRKKEQERIRKEQEQAAARQQTRTQQAMAETEGREAPQVQAAQLGRTPQIERIDAPQAATLGDAGQDIRSRSLQGLDLLQQTAMGQTPSIAQQRFAQNIDRALQAQQAAANTAGSPLAARQAQLQGAQLMQGAAAEAGLLEQQERQAAQQAFLGAAGQVRGQDLQRAQAEAGLQQQATLAGTELAQQRALTQAQLEQRQELTGAELEQQARLQNAQFVANRQQAMDEITRQGLASGLTLEQARLQAEQRMAEQEAQLGAAESQFGRELAFREREGGKGRTERREKSQRDLWAKILGGSITGGASVAAAAVSDERAKENVADGSDSVQAFLDSISPKDFNYKGDASRKTGVMAQDVESTPLGEPMVEEMQGLKTVQPDIGMLLASLSQINERLKGLEGGRA